MATFRRRRIRRVLKWGGLGLCLALLGVYVATGFLRFCWGWRPWGWLPSGPYYIVLYSTETRGDARILVIENGCLYFHRGDASDNQLEFCVQASDEYGMDLWPEYYPSVPAVPLWPPCLLIVIPTAILFWRDRRRIPPGHCQRCGYDLTGNVSGTCPECGERI